MTRFTTLAAAAVTLTYLLVLAGALVRATESGLGCPDWPTCYGSWVPPMDDPNAVIEWSHRTIAALTGAVVGLLAVVAILRHRDRPALVVASVAAAALVVFQAWLGKVTVESELSGEIVTAHLATAMGLFALLLFVFVRSRHPARVAPGGWTAFTILAGLTALATYGLLLLGAHVTATGTALVFDDWPLMDGSLFPVLDPGVLPHVVHRWATVAVGILVMATVVAARRGAEAAPVPALAALAGALYLVQVVIGGAQVLTHLAPWTQVAHVGLAAAIFGVLTLLAMTAHYQARMVTTTVAADALSGGAGPGGTLRAYVALTKPRIIELLLVTTVPTMILAEGGVPSLALIGAVLVGGTLAAGGANAINQYLDRDIDQAMRRTRNRPLPRQAVSPHAALVFGIALSVLSFAWLTVTVNLLSAVLAASAIVFYVVVYTGWLKRTTPQNIVIGGAAGCVPVLVAWAAVTETVGLEAMVLFAVIFVWTPPHFWALALRYRDDYAAAGVPMLPVVRGEVETARQILVYSLVLVAVSLLLYPAAGMGVVYLLAASGLGIGFVAWAVRVWRAAGAGPSAIGLFRYSTTYLTLLFAAVAADALVRAAIG